MKPNKETVEFLKKNYPDLELFYDPDNGEVWGVSKKAAIRWVDGDWAGTCLNESFCKDFYKRIN